MCSLPWIRHLTADIAFNKVCLDANKTAAEHRQAVRLALFNDEGVGDAVDVMQLASSTNRLAEMCIEVV